MEVEVKVSSGNCSTSKKSALRTWPSRLASPESKLAAWMVAVTEERSRVSPRSAVAATSVNLPRTLLMPAWRTVKPTSLCEASRFQVPWVRPAEI